MVHGEKTPLTAFKARPGELLHELPKDIGCQASFGNASSLEHVSKLPFHANSYAYIFPSHVTILRMDTHTCIQNYM